ncbi:MAG: redox-sensing transcriptional repressor Rex [Bacteroidota bacterium]|nr:redox-sensing transcriptional repressor Rex [Bacteroidota bacterium]
METLVKNNFSQLLTLFRFLKLRGRTYVNYQTLAESLRLPEDTIHSLMADIGLDIPDNCEFEIDQGLDMLETLLGKHVLNEAFIAGAGKMGSRLIKNEDFKSCGLRITAAFDVDQSIIGTEINGVKIVSIEKLASLAHRMHIAMGIITTPPDQAQETANIMVTSKIQVIWNFTPKKIEVPTGIILENTPPGANLKQVFTSISERYQTIKPWTLNTK